MNTMPPVRVTASMVDTCLNRRSKYNAYYIMRLSLHRYDCLSNEEVYSSSNQCQDHVASSFAAYEVANINGRRLIVNTWPENSMSSRQFTHLTHLA